MVNKQTNSMLKQVRHQSGKCILIGKKDVQECVTVTYVPGDAKRQSPGGSGSERC